MFKRKKVGLALSGGGARGLAHLGVLKVLEENKIPVDFISGTSMGALVGALYSAQPNIKKLEKELLHEDWKKSFDYTFLPNKGLIKGEKIEAWLEKHIDNVEFKDLRIPLFVTAFDLKNKQEVIFSRGDVAKAVRASISIPGIFVPVENDGRILVDGGIIDPIPTEILKDVGAEVIIAVNVNAARSKKPAVNEMAVRANNKSKIPNIFNSSGASLQIINAQLSKEDLLSEEISLVINVNLEDIGLFDFNKVAEIISKGEKAAKESFPAVKKLLRRNYFKSFIENLNKKTNVDEIIKPIKDIQKEIEGTKRK